MHIQLFHLPNSRSQRIIWLLEELQLEYEITQCAVHKNDVGLEQLKKLDITAKFPIVQITHQQEKFILKESIAIMEYLIFYSQNMNNNMQLHNHTHHYYYWKNFSEATVLPDLVLKHIFHQIMIQSPFLFRIVPKIIKYAFDQSYLNPMLKQHMQAMDLHLAQHQWFAGDQFTIADILLWFPILAYVATLDSCKKFPHIETYLENINQRPAFQKALDKGQWSQETFDDYWKSSW